MTRVKICGITRLEDALLAAELGADFLGFNFYSGSTRYINFKTCQQISAELDRQGSKLLKVGVFVNANLDEIEACLEACRLDLAQLSGDEPPSLVASLGERGFKAIRPHSLEEAREAARSMQARKSPPTLLVDAHQSGGYGGSGKTGDWDIAAALEQDIPILLAGGLTPDNVAQAIRWVQPWGVDVASGVESTSGIKDRAKMAAFIKTVKEEGMEEIECWQPHKKNQK
jgi:phosphoribosylanthranilate isomerase